METNAGGLLIAVEGIDGAGKTTLVGSLFDFFVEAGISVVRSKEPTDGQWGRYLRETVHGERWSWQDELVALKEDRREHVDTLIRPALDVGKTVIVDRYFYSSAAYQGAKGGDPETIIGQMEAFAPTPDVTFLLDVEPEVGLNRIRNGRGEVPNSFEQKDSLTISRRLFLGLAANHKSVQVIDGMQSVEWVRQQVLRVLLNGLLHSRHCAKAYGCDDPYHCVPRQTGSCLWANMWKIGRIDPA